MSHPALRHLHPDERLGIAALGEPVNHDLVIHPVSASESATHQLSYHGGETLRVPNAWLVFVGDFWANWRTAERACRDILEGGYLSELGPYGAGNGKLLGVAQVDLPPAVMYRDSDIRVLVSSWIVSGAVPPPDAETIYILCMPAGVSVVFDGDDRGSCETWCGYHSSGWTLDGRRFVYTVQPATTCAPCGGDFDAWTMVLAHEIAEAATDPFATGWYDNSDGSENADIVAWVRHQYGPWVVQGYWTNEHGDTLGQFVPEDQRPGHVPEPPPALTYADGVRDGYRQALTDAQDAIDGLRGDS